MTATAASGATPAARHVGKDPMTAHSTSMAYGLLRRSGAWANRVGLTRWLAISLTVAAIGAGFATYAALTASPPLGPDPKGLFILLNVDLVILLLLGTVVARRVVQVWIERRRGSAGSRLHVRLVVMFSLLAATPAIIVALFSAFFFNFGIQGWFSERVRTALHESLEVTDKYLAEHQKAIRANILAMAANLDREGPLLLQLPGPIFQQFVMSQADAHSLPEVLVFEGSGRVLGSSALSFGLRMETLPDWAMARARQGEVVVMVDTNGERVRALTRLGTFFDTYLYAAQFAEPAVLGHFKRTQKAVKEFEQLEGRRSGLQISFFMLFAVVALLLLLAAIWVGLMFATQLAQPISALIAAAERVRGGDLSARVEEGEADDELTTLSRSFNRMTSEIERNREELVTANRQLDARRQFTETVLAGVSAGVIGLDAEGKINLPNRSASELLSTDLSRLIDAELAEAVPEMADMLDAVRRNPGRLQEAQIDLRRDGRARTFLVRIAAERVEQEIIGFVVTFDDVTELLSAQRKAAWADVARRIAHEIKNPLTPIQLSAERLKRLYLKEIRSDPETFKTCTDTIVRQVADIGRMVDEFSAFARMPAPTMREEDISEICRQALFLQRSAHPTIAFSADFPEQPARLECDRRQVGQAVTNLLQNAIDSVLDHAKDSAQESSGRVALTVAREDGHTVIEVEDDGAGLPPDLRDRLTEPYVTTRSKGTGLGLAIVRKIMEDHGGELLLANREQGGARARLVFAGGAGQTIEATMSTGEFDLEGTESDGS